MLGEINKFKLGETGLGETGSHRVRDIARYSDKYSLIVGLHTLLYSVK